MFARGPGSAGTGRLGTCGTRSSLYQFSAGGVPVEEIARLAGHQQTSTTELVYRRELRPVITTGAEIMDRIFVVGRSE